MRPSRLPLLVLLGASSLPFVPAHARDLEVRPDTVRIARVTVYADRAEVVREARVTLPSGDAEVVVAGIPDGIEADSIRVRAHGVPAVLGALQVREEVRKAEPGEEAARAEREARRVMDELAEVDGEAAVDAELHAFLKTIAEALGQGRVDPQLLGDTYSFVRTSLSDLKRRDLDRQERRRALQEQLALAQAALTAARPPASIRSRLAAVDLHAERGGALTLELAYVVHGAGWRPLYRATLDGEAARVELVHEAVVSQTTGEDWTDAALTLSTAMPGRAVAPPAVVPWIVRVAPPGGPFGSDFIQALPVPGRFYQNVLTLAPGVGDGEGEASVPGGVPGGFVQPVEMANARVEIAETAYEVAFVVPGSTDVPADGREHRVVLRRTTLPVRLSYFVAPRLRPSAFLTATAPLPDGAPLLRGPVRISNGSAYLGTWMVGETAPGSELRFPFGEDARVKVSRVTLPEERSHEGLGDRTRQTVAAFRTRLENLRPHAVSIRLEEAIPVSEDERVKVELARSTTAGSTEVPDRAGVRRWELTLEPREVREVQVGYELRWPRDVALATR